MKKTLLTAAFAALALGAAQATEITWANIDGYTAGTLGTLPNGAHIAPGFKTGGSQAGVLRVIASFTSSSDSYSGSLLSFGDDENGHASSSPTVWMRDGILHLGIGDADAHTTKDDSIAQLLDGQKHELALAVERTTNARMNASLFVDGVEIYTITNATVSSGDWWVYKFVLGNKVNMDEAANGIAFEDFEVAYAQATIDDLRQTYSIPEPTALALLALGVAGVALRRRVA